MKVLMIGGAGYVGSACLRWLNRNGHNAVAYDNLSEGNAAAVPDGQLVVGDILDGEYLRQIMIEHGIEAVMHFAALASVPESIKQPQLYWTINVAGTKQVLDAMQDVGISKLVFSSTAATYSFDAPMPLEEQSPQLPRVPYGTTKLAVEWMIKDYASANGWSYAILRYFNAAGADPDGNYGEDRRNESHLIPLILHTAIGKRDEVLIHGVDWDTPDGSCIRDYVHTDDLAQAHQLALEHLQSDHTGVYNIGTGTGISVLEVFRACELVVGHSLPHKIVARRQGDPPVLVANSTKLKRELSWQPRFVPIRAIVETAWRWHKLHPQGYTG